MRLTKTSAALALALGVLLAPALTGCIGNPVEQIVEGAVEQAGGGEVDLNSDGGVPDGFPTEVPLYDGEVVSGISAGAAEAQTWTVSIVVDDVESAFTSIDEQLKAAGFEASLSGFSEGTGTGIYSNPAYGVILTVMDDGSRKTATYVVGSSTGG
jgi:hypothetical protein